jgi:hypothetical protein
MHGAEIFAGLQTAGGTMLEALKKIFSSKESKCTTKPKEEPDEEPTKPGNWREDREWLRSQAKSGLSGEYATLIYTLISHMHGRLHMKSYKMKTGGWRTWGAPKREALPPEKLQRYRKMYGDQAQRYYEGSLIASLEDQAAWIVYLGINAKPLLEISKRILENAYEPKKLA